MWWLYALPPHPLSHCRTLLCAYSVKRSLPVSRDIPTRAGCTRKRPSCPRRNSKIPTRCSPFLSSSAKASRRTCSCRCRSTIPERCSLSRNSFVNPYPSTCSLRHLRHLRRSLARSRLGSFGAGACRRRRWRGCSIRVQDHRVRTCRRRPKARRRRSRGSCG